jgi:O-antigen/teichoic acid export membrane protein
LALGLSYRFDTVLLNISQGDDATGTYNAAYTLVFSVVVISNVINTSLYPTLTRQATNAPETLPAIYGRALKGLLILSLPLAVGGWALAGQIIERLYGDQYAGSVWVLQVVIWAVPLMFVSEFLGYVVLIGRRERSVARAVGISSLANVAGNLALIPLFGIVAAATMTVVTEAVLVAQYSWLLRRELRAMRAAELVLRPVVAALLMGVATLLMQDRVPLLLNIALSAATYLVALLVTGALTRQELAMLRSIRLRKPQPARQEAPALLALPEPAAGAMAGIAATVPAADERASALHRPAG